ncbi:hypothetical protein ROLI_046000 (plasmid) [Roseobacter fucihabitans]|uniref:Uncharacterized protein n=1 Tax=Roseobacter fucihabitans TaxID=1537242 RepID=A0ABZ2BZW1_9RHOB|nr:methyltransferase domain-containing protein [Roseobacter litoralis]MBC6966888.1 Capsule polysaccharide biosynthesis protein [Roseobacter litoralis]
MTMTQPEFLIEVPVEWMTSAIASEATLTTACFTQLVQAAQALEARVETTPAQMYSDAAPRLPAPGQVCISYHSHGVEENVWRVKESYLPGYFTFDRFGYSGFSELAKYPDRFAQDIAAFDLTEARAKVAACKAAFLDANRSKYAQPESQAAKLPEGFVFFPLQTVHDAVAQFAHIRQVDAISYLARASAAAGVALVIKRHPYCQDTGITGALENVTQTYPNVTLVDAPIGELISKAQAVVGANSGVLFEALIAGKPVFSFADSDFAQATQQITDPSDLKAAFEPYSGPDSNHILRFLGWYLSSYCFELDMGNALQRKLRDCLDSVAQKSGAAFVSVSERTKAKQVFADQERGRRNQLSFMMVRNAYRQSARATGRFWALLRPFVTIASVLRHGKRGRILGRIWWLLPKNRRGELDPAYYERLHAEEISYQTNNWLVEYLPHLSRLNVNAVLEVGCGNGKFLRAAAEKFPRVLGADWVQTETLPLELENVSFTKVNLMQEKLPAADAVCSADVLEHMPREKIEQVIDTLAQAGPKQFHVIACYDDGHSHLSVFDPGTWLALFRRRVPDVEIVDLQPRFGDPERLVCVISNLKIGTAWQPPEGNA